MIAVTNGTCGYTEHLERVAEKLHHIRFRVQDLNAVVAHFRAVRGRRDGRIGTHGRHALAAFRPVCKVRILY
jgi:hypothetical protein